MGQQHQQQRASVDLAVELRAIDSIRPYQNNPRRNDSAVDAVVAAASALLRFARESIELDDLAERIEKLEAQSNPTTPERNEAGRW